MMNLRALDSITSFRIIFGLKEVNIIREEIKDKNEKFLVFCGGFHVVKGFVV